MLLSQTSCTVNLITTFENSLLWYLWRNVRRSLEILFYESFTAPLPSSHLIPVRRWRYLPWGGFNVWMQRIDILNMRNVLTCNKSSPAREPTDIHKWRISATWLNHGNTTSNISIFLTCFLPFSYSWEFINSKYTKECIRKEAFSVVHGTCVGLQTPDLIQPL